MALITLPTHGRLGRGTTDVVLAKAAARSRRRFNSAASGREDVATVGAASNRPAGGWTTWASGNFCSVVSSAPSVSGSIAVFGGMTTIGSCFGGGISILREGSFGRSNWGPRTSRRVCGPRSRRPPLNIISIILAWFSCTCCIDLNSITPKDSRPLFWPVPRLSFGTTVFVISGLRHFVLEHATTKSDSLILQPTGGPPP